MKRLIVVLVAFTALVSTAAEAKNQGKVPKDAVPMAPEEITKILSGNTFVPAKSTGGYYFAPDGKLIGLGSGGWFAEGSWAVTGNTWCLDSVWHGPDKSKSENYAQCSEKYKVGKVIYTKNTKGEDKWLGDVWSGEEKKFKKGDIVSAEVEKLKKKYGY